jgi:tetratricopeptide (TPR) repeat protein
MRRAIVVLVIVAGLLMAAVRAEAGWGWHRHHCGWGGHHGHGHGYGWGGYGGFGFSVGYCQPYYGHSYYSSYGNGYGHGCYDYGTSIGIGYYGYRPYGTYYNPAANYADYYLPPLSEPAELTYGPLAVKQFLGLDRNFALGALRERPARLPLVAATVKPPRATTTDRLAMRLSNPESRRKAERYIAEGDALFRVQNFHSALQKYKLASAAAPDVAESYWRQGHALIATRNFDLASGALKRAVALTDDISRGGFDIDDLYGPATMAKTVHLESLAEWTLSKGDAADPYFLLGVFLTYDGQQERAEKFFERASELAGFSGGHIAAFLGPADEEDAPVAAARPGDSLTTPAAPAPLVPVSAGTEI